VKTFLVNMESIESISIADSRLGTSICCSATDNDNHPVENLINSKNASDGFMADYYMRPPVTVTLHLPQPLKLISLEWDCQVGSQLALVHEVWASSSKSSNCGANCKLSKKGACDPPTVFQKIGGGSSQNGKIKFSNKRFSSEGYRLACPADPSVLNAAWCVAIKIVRCRASQVPCIKNLRIFVGKSGESSEFKQLLEKVKQIQHLNRSVSSTVSFFGSREEESEISEVDATDSTVVLNDEDDNLEIPEDYLDEITHELMTIPMTLPSGKTVDRSTVEKCEVSQEMWGGLPRDPFTGQIYTKTLRPVFDSALKSRIDRFLLENGSRVGGLSCVGRTVGSAEKISQFLEDKSRGVKRGYQGEVRKLGQSEASQVQKLSINSRKDSSSVFLSTVRQLPQIIQNNTHKSSVEIKQKKN